MRARARAELRVAHLCLPHRAALGGGQRLTRSAQLGTQLGLQPLRRCRRPAQLLLGAAALLGPQRCRTMSLRIERLGRLGRAQPHGFGLGGTLGQLGFVPGAHVREPLLRRGALCAQLGLEVVTRLLQHLPLTLHPLQLAPSRLLLLELRQLLLELLRLLDLIEQLCGVSCLQLLVGRACSGCSAATTLQRGQAFLQRLVLAGQLLHGFEHADVLGAQHLLRRRHGQSPLKLHLWPGKRWVDNARQLAASEGLNAARWPRSARDPSRRPTSILGGMRDPVGGRGRAHAEWPGRGFPPVDETRGALTVLFGNVVRSGVGGGSKFPVIRSGAPAAASRRRAAAAVPPPPAAPEMAARPARDPLHTSLMPPIPRTKSLFELPKRDSQDYRFRNTVAFWIAVSFVEGSLLFICGALASALKLKEAWKQRGLIEFAYFAGSLFYTFGSYLGFFQVINLGRGLC